MRLLIFFLLFTISTQGQVWITTIAQSGTASPAPPATGTPLLSNFRVDDANTDRIKFDASASIAGLTVTGFAVEGETVQSLVIDGDNLGGAIVLGRNLNFYDNVLIRRSNNNTLIHDFTVQYVDNQISEPTTSVDRYVTLSGSDSNGGTNDTTDAWRTLTHAMSQVSAGTTIWVKAGDYGNEDDINITTNGTLANPIKIIGYKNTPGDAALLTRTPTQSTTLNSAEMPLYRGTGTDWVGWDANVDRYYIVKNIQVSSGSLTRTFPIGNASYLYFYNCYSNGEGSTDNGFWANLDDESSNVRLERCTADRHAFHAIRLNGTSHALIDCWSVVDDTTSQDYYIGFNGSDVAGGGHSLIIKNCYAWRDEQATHTGHGLFFKANDDSSPTRVIEYSLIEDSEVWNMANGGVELRHSNVQYNTVRRVYVDCTWRDGDPVFAERSSGINYENGPKYNSVEDCLIMNQQFGTLIVDSTESLNNPTDDAEYNTMTNVIYENCTVFIGPYDFGTGINMGVQTNNTWANCTFIGGAQTNSFFNGSLASNPDRLDDTNLFINCIIDGISTEDVDNGADVTWQYNAYTSSFTPAGASNFSQDTQLNASYVPQATFTDIDVPTLSNPRRDYDQAERENPNTTVGAKKSPNE